MVGQDGTAQLIEEFRQAGCGVFRDISYENIAAGRFKTGVEALPLTSRRGRKNPSTTSCSRPRHCWIATDHVSCGPFDPSWPVGPSLNQIPGGRDPGTGLDPTSPILRRGLRRVPHRDVRRHQPPFLRVAKNRSTSPHRWGVASSVRFFEHRRSAF